MVQENPETRDSLSHRREETKRPGFLIFSIGSLVILGLFHLWANNSRYGSASINWMILNLNLLLQYLGMALPAWIIGILVSLSTFRNNSKPVKKLDYLLAALIPIILMSFITFLGAFGSGAF